MTITEFLKIHRLKPYGSVINSWDSFTQSGTPLMQLWRSPDQVVRNHTIPGAYLRVCCWETVHYESRGKRHVVGYNGRRRSIELIERGSKGYAVMSSPPNNQRGSGVWARYADFDRVYPIVGIERSDNGDVFAILGKPIPVRAIE